MFLCFIITVTFCSYVYSMLQCIDVCSSMCLQCMGSHYKMVDNTQRKGWNDEDVELPSPQHFNRRGRRH